MEALKIDIEKSSVPNLMNVEIVINNQKYGGILYKEENDATDIKTRS